MYQETLIVLILLQILVLLVSKMDMKINIAIDGHSSCGKSSIAKFISKRFEMIYVDSGAMYRALTYYCITKKIIIKNKINISLLNEHINRIDIIFNYNKITKKIETFLNGKNVESFIRSFEVSQNVSKVSQIKQVRDKLIDIQKDIIKKKNVVMDGRDIGTKVMPNAEIKLFVTADVKIRAKRRFDEVNENDHNLTYEKVFDNLVERDFDDENRKLNPLIRASDSILFDNTSISEEEQYNYITDLIKTKKNILCK